MKLSPRPCRTAELSKSLHHQLNKYALAAGAAGVGALALAQPAGARIIYTPADKSLPLGNSYLDLNHDGINDFRFSLVSGGTFTHEDYLAVLPVGQGNETWFSTSYGFKCAYPVKRGSQIGPLLRRFGGGYHFMFLHDTGGLHCGWNQIPTRAYLGLKFVIKGKDHYGWARFVTTYFPRPAAKLTGYAYETIPNKSIIAGATKEQDVVVQPATLGGLARGRK